MQDVGFFNVDGYNADLVIENGDLKDDSGLETAVLISLFTDKRATLEELPTGEQSQKGWWADQISTPSDDQIGSLLWTLDRSKINESTVVAVEDLAKKALQWMIEDGLAKSVEVSAEISDSQRVNFAVAITRPDGKDVTFEVFWNAQALKG